MLKRFFDEKFIKFALVGLVNTLFGTAIMFGFYNILGFSYWISSAANYVLASILSYFLNKHFTFKNTAKGAGQIVRFAVNIGVCWLIAYGIAKPFVRFILSNASKTLQDNIAMLVGMGLFVILNYAGQRFFVFKDEQQKNI